MSLLSRPLIVDDPFRLSLTRECELVSLVRGADRIDRLEFAAPGQRCRNVISRSNVRPTGRFPSVKVGRHVAWDSVHELNAFRLLESDASICRYAEQPCVVHYRLDGMAHRHYPDILVEVAAADMPMLWEVKTYDDASRPEVLRRTALMTRELPRFGYEYRLVLAEALARQPHLDNAKALLRHARRNLSFETRLAAQQLFASRHAVDWADFAVGRLLPLRLADAYALVLRGDLIFDVDEPLAPGNAFTVSRRSALLGVNRV